MWCDSRPQSLFGYDILRLWDHHDRYTRSGDLQVWLKNIFYTISTAVTLLSGGMFFDRTLALSGDRTGSVYVCDQGMGIRDNPFLSQKIEASFSGGLRF